MSAAGTRGRSRDPRSQASRTPSRTPSSSGSARRSAGGAGGRPGRGGDRPLLRARGPGRDHGPAAGRARRAAPGAGRQLRPRPPGMRGLSTSATSCCATLSIGAIPAADRGGYHARAGGVRGARWRAPSEIHVVASTTSGPAFAGVRSRRPVAGAREAARLSAHREAFELYRRAVENLPDELDRSTRAISRRATPIEAPAIEENEIAERMAYAARRWLPARGPAGRGRGDAATRCSPSGVATATIAGCAMRPSRMRSSTELDATGRRGRLAETCAARCSTELTRLHLESVDARRGARDGDRHARGGCRGDSASPSRGRWPLDSTAMIEVARRRPDGGLRRGLDGRRVRPRTPGFEDTRRVRPSATPRSTAVRVMDYPRAARYLAERASVRRLDRAVASAPTSWARHARCVAWATAGLGRGGRPRPAGHRRPRLPPRGCHGTLGARLRRAGSR